VPILATSNAPSCRQLLPTRNGNFEPGQSHRAPTGAPALLADDYDKLAERTELRRTGQNASPRNMLQVREDLSDVRMLPLQ
jgi:hypothetical protein